MSTSRVTSLARDIAEDMVRTRNAADAIGAARTGGVLARDFTPPAEQPRRTVQRLPLAVLETDKYQRGLNQRHANKIARNFDPDAARMPIVSARDGRYFVIDGQHTVEALKQRDPIASVECLVYSGLTYQREAELFAKLNSGKGRLNPTERQTFKAELEAANEQAWALYDCAQALGLTFLGVDGGRSESPTKIGAIGTLRTIHDRDGIEHVRAVLVLLRDMFGNEIGAFAQEMIAGTSRFLRHYPDPAVLTRLRQRLATMPLSDFQAQVRQLRAALRLDGPQGVERALIITHDHGLRASKRLENRND